MTHSREVDLTTVREQERDLVHKKHIERQVHRLLKDLQFPWNHDDTFRGDMSRRLPDSLSFQCTYIFAPNLLGNVDVADCDLTTRYLTTHNNPLESINGRIE